MNPLQQPKDEYLKLGSFLNQFFEKNTAEKQREVLEALTYSQSMRESILQPSPSFVLENSPANELFLTKDFMGTGNLQNFSMIQKLEGMSINYDMTEGSLLFDQLNHTHFYGEPDEPVRSKKMTKVSADVNRSTYVTLEAQMSRKYKER